MARLLTRSTCCPLPHLAARPRQDADRELLIVYRAPASPVAAVAAAAAVSSLRAAKQLNLTLRWSLVEMFVAAGGNSGGGGVSFGQTIYVKSDYRFQLLNRLAKLQPVVLAGELRERERERKLSRSAAATSTLI